MRAQNFLEIESIASAMQEFCGGFLQEIYAFDHDLVLGFYQQKKLHWLWCDLTPSRPALLLLDELPQKSKLTKPTLLFLKANAVGKRLNQVNYKRELGRVLELLLGERQGLVRIEIVIVPHKANVGVFFEKKKIFWSKPKELSQVATDESGANSDTEVRSIVEMKNQWMASRWQVRPTVEGIAVTGEEVERQRKIKKLMSAIEKMQLDLIKKTNSQYAELGERLKSTEVKDLTEDLQKLCDLKLSRTENMQRAFEKAKDNARKINAAKERLADVQKEVEQLKLEVTSQSGSKLTPAHLKSSSAQKKQLMKTAGAQGRTKKFSEQVSGYLGKNAVDNLKLLRQAKAWDLWLHLKDYPGAYLILNRPKNHEISDELLKEAALWLARETVATKRDLRSGDVFEVQVAECRFIRPIKGDRLGRVVVQEQRVLRVKFS